MSYDFNVLKNSVLLLPFHDKQEVPNNTTPPTTADMIVEMELNMNLGYFLQPFTDNRDVSILEQGVTKILAKTIRKKMS